MELLTDESKKFIQDNIELIDNNEFDTFLKKLNKESSSIKYDVINILQSCSIDFLNSVTHIPNYMFSGTNLENVTIPDSVISIGNMAFNNCKKLRSVIIPNSITSLSSGAFHGCTELETITLPESMKRIGDTAFQFCIKLTSIKIPSGVTIIEESTFSYCKSLTNITIPIGVTRIGNSAFSYCSSLTSITIPDSVTSIGEDTFWKCGKLKDVYYTGIKEQWKAIKKNQKWKVKDNSKSTMVIHCLDGDIKLN